MPPHPLTEVDIAAPPAIVWQVLIDFPAYADWNPRVRFAAPAALGRRLPMTVTLFNRTLTVPIVVEAMDGERQLRWRGGPAWLMQGIHHFDLCGHGPATTRVTHGERFRGAAVPLLWPVLRGELMRFYAAINAALKVRAERLAGGAAR